MRRISAQDLTAFLLCVAVAIAIAAATYQSSFILCVVDCGETFIALHQVDNYRNYGTLFGLLEDHTVHGESSDAPFLYTHNVNIGSHWYVLLDLLGLMSLESKQLATIGVFSMGLLYVYLAVSRYSGNRILGLVALALFATEYKLVLSFATNALRAWHWLGLFALVYHGQKAATQGGGNRTFHLGIFLVALFATFGIGYEFYVAAFLCAALVVAWEIGREGNARHWVVAGLLASAFVLPPALRQVQVMSVMGFDFWRTDLLLTFLAKTPSGAALWYGSVPDQESFYRDYNVLRPPAQPVPPLTEWVVGALTTFEKVFVPLIGLLSLGLTLIVAGIGFSSLGARLLTASGATPAARRLRLAAAIVALALFAFSGKVLLHRSAEPQILGLYSIRYASFIGLYLTAIGAFAWICIRERTAASLANSARRMAQRTFSALERRLGPHVALSAWNGMQLAALLLLAMFVGLIVLAPFSLQVFLKHHFPLLIAPVLVAKACVVLLATAALTRAIGARRWKGAVIAGTLALAVVADHVKLQYDNFLASVPLDLGWMPEVRSRSQHTFAVSWIPSTVAFFVDRWAVGIRPGMEQSLAERARERRFRINKEDLYLAGPNAKRADDRQDWPPDFWLYFPIDWLVPADRASADCRQDYVGKLISAAVRPLSGRAPIVLPNPARSESQSSESGKVVHLIYRADIPDPVSWRVQVVAANRREAAVRTDSQAIEPHPRRTSDELWIGYNCLTQNLHVVTSAGSPGASTLRLEYTGTKPLPAVDVELPLDLAFAGDTFFPILGAGQPSALDLARRASELRVAAMGVGYVLFDLRPLKQKAAAEPQNRKR